MFPQHEPTGFQSQQSIKVLNSPGLPVGFAGSTGIPTGKSEPHTERRSNYHPPLPGMETYCQPEGRLLELDNSSETLTDTLNRILSNPSRRDLSDLTHDQRQTLLDYEEAQGFGVGACLNVYPSGEITGGCYSRGNKRAPGRTGKAKSTEFTRQAKKKIRRAVDCRITSFKLFITLTCDPSRSTLDEDGRVCQEWAKKQFTKFLNTLKKKYDRMAEKTGKVSWRLSYIWVAEVQQNGNIHFHLLVDRQFIEAKYLVKIWGQANNSVNVKRLNNQDHAVNYMLKYMKKGNCPIDGKRYGMTQNLLQGSKPVKYDFYGRSKRNAFLRIKERLEWEIKENGGYVADWGMSLPAPKRVRFWRDKLGRIHTTRGTSAKTGMDFITMIQVAMDGIDTVLAYDDEPIAVDLPF
ncbi:MAG: hypothetical protein P4L44_15245 [Oryzomonas sp.]|uniref:rolling circle replication-associated protein n=1 Tax=Oryzomonas sp. TaxID=2855186 RepID=UPI002840F92D|nr:hypothetical protein [Oryzomonas sp.]MDR3581316.1 hypothetical protein [Oryzomonas sp.]